MGNTGIKVKPYNWSDKSQQVLMKDKDWAHKNNVLKIISSKVKDIQTKYLIEDKVLTMFEFDKQYNNKYLNSKSFYNFVENLIRAFDGYNYTDLYKRGR